MSSYADWEIPTNFTIPKGYQVRFVFRGQRGVLRVARAGRRKLRFEQTGSFSPVEQSMALDWIQETVERMRFESRPYPT